MQFGRPTAQERDGFRAARAPRLGVEGELVGSEDPGARLVVPAVMADHRTLPQLDCCVVLADRARASALIAHWLLFSGAIVSCALVELHAVVCLGVLAIVAHESIQRAPSAPVLD